MAHFAKMNAPPFALGACSSAFLSKNAENSPTDFSHCGTESPRKRARLGNKRHTEPEKLCQVFRDAEGPMIEGRIDQKMVKHVPACTTWPSHVAMVSSGLQNGSAMCVNGSDQRVSPAIGVDRYNVENEERGSKKTYSEPTVTEQSSHIHDPLVDHSPKNSDSKQNRNLSNDHTEEPTILVDLNLPRQTAKDIEMVPFDAALARQIAHDNMVHAKWDLHQCQLAFDRLDRDHAEALAHYRQTHTGKVWSVTQTNIDCLQLEDSRMITGCLVEAEEAYEFARQQAEELDVVSESQGSYGSFGRNGLSPANQLTSTISFGRARIEA